jgi:hypothetical protein
VITSIFETWDRFWRKAMYKFIFILIGIAGGFWLMAGKHISLLWALIQSGQFWWQSKLEFYDWLEIYMYYLLLFVLIRTTWYFFWDQFHELAKGLYQTTAIHLVRKNKLGLLIRLIQWHILWYSRFYDLVIERSRSMSELSSVRLLYDSDSLRRTLKTSPRVFIFIKSLLLGLLSIPSLCAMLFLIAIQIKGSPGAAWKALLSWLTNADIKSILIDLLSNTPNAIVLLGVVFILFYLNSLRGIVRRAIANANKSKLGEAINIHRTLVPLINNGLSTAIENMEIIKWDANRIANIWLRLRYEDVNGIEQVLPQPSMYETLNEVYDRLQTIPEIEQIIRTINQPDDMFWMQRHIHNLSYRLRGWWLFSKSNMEDNLHKWWFTPNGLKIMFNARPKHLPQKIETLIHSGDIDKAKAMLEEGRNFMQRNIHEYIVQAFEAQVLLFAYAQQTNVILRLNSDKFGRLVRSLFDREG